jgi:outer membrane protein insertion porin family
VRAIIVIALLASSIAHADSKPLVGVRVQGDSKVTDETALRLSRLELGEGISAEQLTVARDALLSSELFKAVEVTLEDAPGGYVLVATLTDKLSWVVAPALYVLSDAWSVGAGFVENNLFGEDKKVLLYGQVGSQSSLFFGTYYVPSFRGTQLMLRFDAYFLHRVIDEYENPHDDPTSRAIARTSTWTWIDPAALVGWRWAWWLSGDLRFKPAYAKYTDVIAADPATQVAPEKDGWDVSWQARLTLDRRQHLFGVTWGPYAQLFAETSVPGLSDYDFQVIAARAFYSWRFFREHQLEFRVGGGIGRHLPLHDELTIGGISDLRGYAVDRFRGDRRAAWRAEYSVPLFKYKGLAFRALGFYDGGYTGFGWRAPEHRAYLPSATDGAHWVANDVGAGLRIYIKAIVLPLLGFDLAYGIEGKQPEVYFELGLTDF